MDAYQHLIQILSKAKEPLESEENNYDTLIKHIRDSRFVLLGESTHGTHEFYQARIEITQQLICKKGFLAIAIEGDWPDVYQINRYVKGAGEKENVIDATRQFMRFPTWMWRNKTILPFLRWLREYNDNLPHTQNKIGVYGLDLYSLHASMQAVIKYLTKIDGEAAKRAKQRYACFDHTSIDPQAYGYLTTAGIKKDCIKEVVDELIELQGHALDYVKRDNAVTEDDYFYAMQNARVVKNAENYYRTMFETHSSSWNIRDTHMMETLNILADYLEKQTSNPAKIIVWAHNSHAGDARATEMKTKDEINLGQLVREQHADMSYSVGFSTYTGTVTAADDWGSPPKFKQINPGITSSYEDLFHQVADNFMLILRGNDQLNHYLHLPRLQRAIGVVYRPQTERQSHYFFTHLPDQFDSIIHFDVTKALEPID